MDKFDIKKPRVELPKQNQWNISCHYFRYKRYFVILICIILISIIITVPTILVNEEKINTNTKTTTTEELNYDDQTIFVTQLRKHLILELKLNHMNFSIVVDAKNYRNETFQFWDPIDIVFHKQSHSIIICGQQRQVIRWSYPNVRNEDESLYVTDGSNHRVVKWMKNAKGGIIVAGGNGDQLNQLSKPSSVTIDHLANVYVTDTANHRVMRWINGAKEGTIVVGGNRQGNQTNQLHRPTDFLFDKYGNLYVYDSVNRRIQK